MQPNLVLIRHGQSIYNNENRFAGWVDTTLTDTGRKQAADAAALLKEVGFKPDMVLISPLTRTIQTADEMLKIMGIPADRITKDARLVERSYGGLTGKNKAEALAELGEEKFKEIRRGYATKPPAMDAVHPMHGDVLKSFNSLMKGTFADTMPATESLQEVEARVLPFYNEILKPALLAGKTALVVAHGNSLRALIKIIKEIPADQINAVELETAQPTGFTLEQKAGTLKVTADSLKQPIRTLF